jgi:hypothetical protein
VGLVSRPPGTLTVNLATGAFTYLPPVGVKSTSYKFVYRARDSHGLTANFTVTLLITPQGKLDGQ